MFAIASSKIWDFRRTKVFSLNLETMVSSMTMHTPDQKKGFVLIRNQQTVALRSVPVLPYDQFYQAITSLLHDKANHCINYYAYPNQGNLKFIACLANDNDAT